MSDMLNEDKCITIAWNRICQKAANRLMQTLALLKKGDNEKVSFKNSYHCDNCMFFLM